MLICEEMMPDSVEKFYGQNNGWRMFDGKMLTPDVADFLIEEKRGVAAYLEKSAGTLHQFLEIGCGYGRYLHVALKHGVNYRGIELVKWLAELGKVRVSACSLPPNCSAQIEHLSAEHLHCVFPNPDSLLADKCCVFFPFNCFGNLRSPRKVLSELNGRNVEVIISNFSCSEEATQARLRYYAKCGCTELSSQQNAAGMQISSCESLQSLAYRPESLEVLMNEFGFRLTQRLSLSSLGSLFFFSPFRIPEPEISPRLPTSHESFLLQGFIEEPQCVEEDKSHALMGHIKSIAWGVAKNAGMLSVYVHDVGWTAGGLAWLTSSTINDNALAQIATGTISQVVECRQLPGTVNVLINTY